MAERIDDGEIVGLGQAKRGEGRTKKGALRTVKSELTGRRHADLEKNYGLQ